MKDRLLPDRMNYIFLDEVQRVSDFKKAVDSLFIKKNCDVYIAGSNAYLLSGELATLLSGRYVEIKMLPLSFKEYVSAFPENSSIDRLYQDYIHKSSFPYLLEMKRPKKIRQYLSGILDSIMRKDIVSRRRFPDIGLRYVSLDTKKGDEGEEYYQVAYSMIDTDGKTLKRGLAPLDAINDHNPKYLLTMVLGPLISPNGISGAGTFLQPVCGRLYKKCGGSVQDAFVDAESGVVNTVGFSIDGAGG